MGLRRAGHGRRPHGLPFGVPAKIVFSTRRPFYVDPCWRPIEPAKMVFSTRRPFYVKFSTLGLTKAWPCRQLRQNPSKTAHAIRTLYTALGEGQVQSDHV